MQRPNVEHWRSLKAYRAVVAHWFYFFVFVGAGAVGLIQEFVTTLALPTWAWFLIAVVSLTVAQFRAFHDVRMERDVALAQVAKSEKSVFSEDRSHFEVGRLWSFIPSANAERLLVVDLNFTNRQPASRVRLDAELMWEFVTSRGRLHGKPIGFLRCFDHVWKNQLHPPLDLGPQKGVEGPLVFRVIGEESMFHFTDDQDVFVESTTTALFLRLTDHVSGEVRDLPLDLPIWEEATSS